MGFPTALGAKLARPELPVVSVNGDGGFMFNVQELATAVQFRIGVVSIVFNDNAYGNVRRMQQDHYGGRVIASELGNPDFVRLAESFGAVGLRAASPSELRAVLRRALKETGPVLIEVPIGETPAPWDFIQLPRVRPPRKA
jgi:acetolactate synthase-1/2/3 large subunit